MVKRGCLGISLLQDPLHKECKKKVPGDPTTYGKDSELLELLNL